jgi:hypothetical protein
MSGPGYDIELPVLGIATRFETSDARVASCAVKEAVYLRTGMQLVADEINVCSLSRDGGPAALAPLGAAACAGTISGCAERVRHG